MNDTQSYIIDVITLVPNNSICYIQAPSIENSGFLSLMQPSSLPHYSQIVLTLNNKKLLTELIANENVEEYFQSIEIRYNNKLLFEGYDSMKYGTISKELELSTQFKKMYIKEDMCIISEDW